MVSLAQINGASMNPNFDNGEILLYNRLDRNIQYGNVIIFQKHNKKYVKVVFGKPGDTVAVSGDGVYILRIKNNEPFPIICIFNYIGRQKRSCVQQLSSYFN